MALSQDLTEPTLPDPEQTQTQASSNATHEHYGYSLSGLVVLKICEALVCFLPKNDMAQQA